MVKRLTMLLAGLFITIGVALAQSQVSGTVTDENGDPIVGAAVRVVDTKTGTVTNNDGRFNLTLPTGKRSITVSYLGMKTVTVKASNGMTVKLYSEDRKLDEVVVTALGIKRQKRDLGYSTEKVDSKLLTEGKAVNVASGLQGKVAGLNISTLNSGVFENVKINMRGIRSLTGNNNPMLLLDGVPVSLNYLSSLNPNDIDNVNILKGTSAAAIYGPDARNGVIVVTTKQGAEGGAPRVTFSSSVQASNISFFPKFQERFGSGGGTGYDFIPYENESWGPEYDGSMRQLGKPDEKGSVMKYPYAPIKNNRKDFFNTGLTFQNDLSLAMKDFYISFQDARVKGIVPDDWNQRTGLRFNGSREYKNFKVSLGANYIQQNYDVYSSKAMYNYYKGQDVGMHDGLMDLVFATQAWVPLTKFKTDDPWGNYNTYYCDFSLNPYQAIETFREKGRKHDFIGNIDLKYSPFSWMDLNLRVAVTHRNISFKQKQKNVSPSEYAAKERSFRFIPQRVSDQNEQYYRLSTEPFITLHKTVGDFNLGGVLGTYMRTNREDYLGVAASPLKILGLYNVSGRTGEVSPTERTIRTRMFSVYGSATVTYKNFATLEVTGRNDKVSVLAPGHNSYFYPGVNASVVLTDAIPAIKSDFLNFLKLRASWNKTGNADVAAYRLNTPFEQKDGFPYDGLPGYKTGERKTDPNLSPEFINSTEVGFETSMLKNRITLDFTYYNQKNTDQLIYIRTSRGTGYTSRLVNAASFRNYGFETTLKLTPLVNFGDVNVNLNLNYGYNNSEVLSLYEGMDNFFLGGYFMAGAYAVVGKPAFIYSAKDYKRDPQGRVVVDKETGLPQIQEQNKYFGRTMPIHTLGINPSIRWKGLTVSAVFEYKGGNYSFNYQGTTMAWDGQSRVTAANSRQRFVFPNSVYIDGQDANGNPVYVANTNRTVNSNYAYFHGDNYRSVGTNFLFSANTWRWRELSITYSLPAEWLKFQNYVKGVDVAFTGRNLMLWLPKSNEWSDPDFSVYKDQSAGTITSEINPPTRTLGGSITLTF